MQINRHFLEVADSYLFSTIAHKVNEYTAANPDKKIIRLGIGDVTRPLAPAVIDAFTPQWTICPKRKPSTATARNRVTIS